MATEKILNTRVILKNDTLANFNNSTFIPKKGEMLLAEVTTAQNNGQVVPTYLIKVGDGENKFADLKYAAAQAADVYAWAKQANLPIEKEGTGNVVSNIEWDAENKKIKFSTASVATAEGLADIQSRVAAIENGYATDKDLEDAVSTLNASIAGKVATSDFETFKTSNTSAIADAKKAGTDANSALEAYKTSNDAAIALKADKSAVDALVIVDDVKYDSTSKTIQLMSGASKVGEGFDASAFIKDGMLEDVAYDADTNTLTFTWNTDAGSKTDTVTLTDILDPYTAGAGISISGTSIALSAETQDSLGKADTAVQPADIENMATTTALNGAINTINGKIANITNGTAVVGQATKATQDGDGNEISTTYKKIQEAVTESDNTFSSETSDYFVKSVAQDAQGKITALRAYPSIGGAYVKSASTYTASDAEVWVFDCGSSTANV